MMKLDLKNIFLYAILPAIIAGLFSIAPKLYDIVTEPNSELTYDTTYGPLVETTTSKYQIISIIVMNSGKRTLSDVVVQLTLSDGNIDAFTIKESSGLNYSVTSSEQKVDYKIHQLLSDEKFTITAMLSSKDHSINPKVTIRSAEVLGKSIEKNKNGTHDITGGILAALSVFTMGFVFFSRKRSSLDSLFDPLDKQEFLFYITIRLELREIVKEMQLMDTNLTYLRMADIFLAHGLFTQNQTEKQKIICALQCLLLVKDMADNSLEVIKNNLKILSGDKFSDIEINNLRDKSIDISNVIELRSLSEQLILNAVSN